MNIDDMRIFVRAHADTDATDAPDANLDLYARVAYNDILSRRNDWPHLNVEYTFNSVVDQNDYVLTTLSVADMQYVSAVSEPGSTGFPLTYGDRETMELLFPSNSFTAKPSFWTLFNGSLMLYPTPQDVITYRVRGYRNPAAWPTDASSEPDLPDRLHDAIPFFMLAQYYRAQEESVLAREMLDQFETLVQRHIRNNPSGQIANKPVILGGRSMTGMTYEQWVRMNVEG